MDQAKITEVRITSALLAAIDRDAAVSQRSIARELGIALGLVNAYLKRCSKKGLVKVRQVPARRYAYYLTPKGLTEKARLTAEYLAYSLSYLRDARASSKDLITTARHRLGWKRIALIGAGELAEIAVLCAYEQEIEIAAVIDAAWNEGRFVNIPVVRTVAEMSANVDGFVITTLEAPLSAYDDAVAQVGSGRVLVPRVLGLSLADGHPSAVVKTRGGG
ncbi:MAG: winged helix-turn-helix transcriptional regulator [Hyphomicrobiaceae bacterium]